MSFMKQTTFTLILFITLISVAKLNAQTNEPPFIKYLNNPWVDSVLSTLSTEQQIAQFGLQAGLTGMYLTKWR